MVFSAWRKQEEAVTGHREVKDGGDGRGTRGREEEGMAGQAYLPFGSLFGVSERGCGQRGQRSGRALPRKRAYLR